MFTLRKITHTLLGILFLSVFVMGVQSTVALADDGAGGGVLASRTAPILHRICPDGVADCGNYSDDPISTWWKDSVQNDDEGILVRKSVRFISSQSFTPIRLVLPAIDKFSQPRACPDAANNCGCDGSGTSTMTSSVQVICPDTREETASTVQALQE